MYADGGWVGVKRGVPKVIRFLTQKNEVMTESWNVRVVRTSFGLCTVSKLIELIRHSVSGF